MLNSFKLETLANRVVASGDLRTAEMRPLFAAIHNLVDRLGYKDIELDFSGLTATFAPPMLAVACQCQSYLKHGVDTFLILPEEERLRRLFVNANWAHLIDPRSQPESNFKGHAQIPAMSYSNARGQYQTVTKILQVLMGALAGLDRSHLSAIEWSINEITDNVLNHSESEIGGLVQVTRFIRNRKAVEFVVCDAGIGIPRTLRSGHSEFQSDTEALDKAIRETERRRLFKQQGRAVEASRWPSYMCGADREVGLYLKE